MNGSSEHATTHAMRDRHGLGVDLYRMLPSVNDLLLTPACQSLLKVHSRSAVLEAARAAVAGLRSEIAAGRLTEETLQQSLARLWDEISQKVQRRMRYSLHPVINATGVILHTNLGRAPLSDAALEHIAEVAQGYCNLEIDLETGTRSRRDAHVESLLLRVLGGEAEPGPPSGEHGIIIVNNCAAAMFLALNSLAEKREVVVSRGELVEIGGGFRIPEILEKSGAVLKEVGTTNRTRLADYERALGSQTGLILRVHQSNFSIEGFAELPALGDLIALAKRTGIPLFEDQGTGLLSPLDSIGIRGEGTMAASFREGVDLITASGDKLMGGPQCGLLVGRKDLIQRIQTNPMLRALRVDKLTYAALEATLVACLSGQAQSLPVQQMLNIAPGEVMRRCQQIAAQIDSSRLTHDVVPVESLVGGGTAPRAALASCAIALRHASLSAAELLSALRQLDPPIIGRIVEDAVLLDLRTVHPRYDLEMVSLLHNL